MPLDLGQGTMYTVQHRLIIEKDRNRQVADSSSVKLNLTEPCRTVPLLRDARPAGWVNRFSICASTMLRAQNRAAEGSILKQRWNTLLIWVYNLSMMYSMQEKYPTISTNIHSERHHVNCMLYPYINNTSSVQDFRKHFVNCNFTLTVDSSTVHITWTEHHIK